MANVIRHKRGTSDPSASDFSQTGELLVNTTDGGVFTKNDSGAVVEIGGITGTSYLRSDADDVYEGGNLTILTNSSSGQYWGFNLKYDSGWEYITTGGYGWAFRNGGTNGLEIRVADAAGTADQTASLKNFFFKSDGTLEIKNGGLDVSGDITVSGNVDGVDIAALKTTVDGAVLNSDLDGKGEILIGDGTGDPTALAVGTNDYVLTADSNEACLLYTSPSPRDRG